MNTIVKLVFGSHLYGTSTPESDTDYKGIYLPSKREIYLNRFPKCIPMNTKSAHSTDKNTKDDIDYEIYSLHYFIELACQGETFALDMVHAPENMVISSSDVWKELVRNRSKLYTKTLDAFVGYARSQAAKYGIKGSRLNDVKMVIDFMYGYPATTRLVEIWDKLPLGENITKDPIRRIREMGAVQPIALYTVCGKKLQESAMIKTVLPSLLKYYEQYGERAKLASKNESIDWKAVSHALRAAYQVREIFETGDLVFPLKKADYLRKIKLGYCDYKTEIGPHLEKEMEELERIAEKSKLPEHVDMKFWDDFILKAYGHLEL